MEGASLGAVVAGGWRGERRGSVEADSPVGREEEGERRRKESTDGDREEGEEEIGKQLKGEKERSREVEKGSRI